MIAITSIVALTRVGIQVLRARKMMVEDYLIFFAFILYIAMTALYIAVTPALYRISDAMAGKIPMYAEMMDDSLFLVKIFFANTMIFWIVLWTVKFSLLALYRRLTIGLHKTYMYVWWGIFTFCAVTLIGCIVSNLTSCSSMHAWFTPGLCTTPRDVRAQIASLYYAFAVDVVSDFMIMAFPIKLIWNLQMPRAQKFSIMALFGLGFVCILFAIVRVVQIGVKANNSSTPSSSWLALWAVIECSIAVIIGCSPAFAALFRRAHSSTKGSYNAQGYIKHPSSRSGAQRSTDVNLKSMVSTTSKAKGSRNDTYWDDANSSQEELAGNDGIVVTKSFKQEHEKVNTAHAV